MPFVHPLGQTFGTETATLTQETIPPHSHGWETYPQPSTTEAPAATMLATNVPSAAAPTFAGIYRTTAPTPSNVGPMASQAIGSTGLGGAHANVMPGLVISFIIALKGNYPTRP
jgi:microcystin-dependent protein